MAAQKSEQRIVGVIAGIGESLATITHIVYWGENRARHDKKKKTWKPQPLSPYWANMDKRLFKNW